VAFVRTDVSEELSASIIRVTRIGELGTNLAVFSNRNTLRRNNCILAFLLRVLRLPVNANDVPISPNLDTLMKGAILSSESSVLKVPHGVTTQKTVFFIFKIVADWLIAVTYCPISKFSALKTKAELESKKPVNICQTALSNFSICHYH
jgi:hypothetical protein